MANMWLWFETQEQRLEFVKQMLKLESVLPQGRSKAAREAAAAENQLWEGLLQSLNEGKTRGAWYQLEKRFYLANLRDYSQRAEFERRVWDMGFRRIYTVRSYFYRPGHWLVLKFRASQEGASMRTWVTNNFPEEQLGLSVPIPPEQIGVFGIWDARYLLSFPHKLGNAQERLARAQELLEQGLELCPHQYRKVDYQLLWEKLARSWEEHGQEKKADYCYRQATEFSPPRPEAWLNLGFFYQRHGREEEAVKAYEEGLANSYYDPYLIYNLAALWGRKGKDKKARGILAEALFERQDLGNYINLKLFADLSMKVGEYQAAHICYNQAFYDAPEDWPEARECLQNMAHALVKDGKPHEALEALENAMAIDLHPETMFQYALTLGYSCREWRQASQWAKKVMEFEPHNQEALNLVNAVKARDYSGGEVN